MSPKRRAAARLHRPGPAGLVEAMAAMVVVALLGIGPEAHGCSCLPPSLARSWDESTDVVRVEIHSEASVGDKVRYTARVVTTYKGDLAPKSEMQFETRYSGSACGLGPGLSGDYLLTTWLDESQTLFATACGFTVPFESLTKEDVDFLEEHVSVP